MSHDRFVDWLLSLETPSIRHLNLRRLPNRPEADAEVRAAARDVMVGEPVPAVLAQQMTSAQWSGERRYYTPKYTTRHWSVPLLTELAVNDDEVAPPEGCDPHAGGCGARLGAGA